MEIIHYKDDSAKVGKGLIKLNNVKKIKGEKFLDILPSLVLEKLYQRIEKTKSLKRCSEPVSRFLGISKKKWLDSPKERIDVNEGVGDVEKTKTI